MANEVHVGDIGTTYRAKLTDNGMPFDPTGATTMEIIFKMPQGPIVKTAVAEQVGDDWYLVYVVTEASFHLEAGSVSIQGYLVFPSGEKYHSNIQKVDSLGRELRVYSNLALP